MDKKGTQHVDTIIDVFTTSYISITSLTYIWNKKEEKVEYHQIGF